MWNICPANFLRPLPYCGWHFHISHRNEDSGLLQLLKIIWPSLYSKQKDRSEAVTGDGNMGPLSFRLVDKPRGLPQGTLGHRTSVVRVNFRLTGILTLKLGNPNGLLCIDSNHPYLLGAVPMFWSPSLVLGQDFFKTVCWSVHCNACTTLWWWS